MKIHLFVLLILFSCAQAPAKKYSHKVSILQGLTQENSVEFTLLVPKGSDYQVVLQAPEGEKISPESSQTVSREDSDFAVLKLLFLKSSAPSYNLFVYDGGKLIDQRLVGHGPRAANKLDLVVASCMDETRVKELGIWDQVAQKNPDYLLLIGDNVYADKFNTAGGQGPTPKEIWQRYVEVRRTLPLYFQEKLIPTHALWDDHDYGLNDAGGDFKFKDASKEIFEAFWAQTLTQENWTKGKGVGGLLALGDFNLYFLDARSFRDADPSGVHLGLAQEDWLISKLREEKNPSLLIKGDQFFGGYHRFESFEGNHPENFQRFVGSLRALTTPFVFVSGDRHLSEIMQFPRTLFTRPSFEITSSPIHARTFPESTEKNPWRVVSNSQGPNFTFVKNEARDNHWFMELENIGPDGNVVYRRELAVFIQDLQNNLNEGRKRRSGRRRYQRRRSRR